MIRSGETAGSLDANQEQNPECLWRIPDLVRYKDNPPGNDHISPPKACLKMMIFRLSRNRWGCVWMAVILPWRLGIRSKKFDSLNFPHWAFSNRNLATVLLVFFKTYVFLVKNTCLVLVLEITTTYHRGHPTPPNEL